MKRIDISHWIFESCQCCYSYSDIEHAWDLVSTYDKLEALVNYEKELQRLEALLKERDDGRDRSGDPANGPDNRDRVRADLLGFLF